MFTDIASFTTLVEGLPTGQHGASGERVSHRNTEIVFDHGGTLMNIIVDALIVMFGAPTDQPAGDGCLRRGVSYTRAPPDRRSGVAVALELE